MKKIGLIGGMSWESSAVYYNLINNAVKKKLKGFHSAKCLLESVDFAEIEKYQMQNDWKTLNALMAQCAKNLEKSGAELIILCTNTMHLCTESIVQAISIPFLHIAEATGEKIKASNIDKVLLLGTKFTMDQDFYKKTLKNKFGIETIIPSDKDRVIIHDIIYTQLVHGIIKKESKYKYLKIIEESILNGAQGVILGCTEIPLLIKENDCTIPVFDTTKIHAEKAVEIALNSEKIN